MAPIVFYIIVAGRSGRVPTVEQIPNSVLQELLNEELGTEPTTVRGLTNHLPMALVAKERLGADADELIRFAAAYSRRVAPLSASRVRLEKKNWKAAIGQSGAAADLRDYFARAVAEVGVDETLRTHLPPLLPGIAGAGFHGAIRLAYAIEVASPSRIAAGLAYLAEVGRPLCPLVSGAATTPDPMSVFAVMSKSQLGSSPPEGKTIDAEMREVAQSESFEAAVSSLEITQETDQKLTEAALHIFAATDDFTALHGVTGLAAVFSLRPWIDDRDQMTRFAFQALSAAYLSIGAPPTWTRERLDEFVGSNGNDPLKVRSVAAASDDEHVSKLVYTAHQLWERTNDPLYLAVAARRAHP